MISISPLLENDIPAALEIQALSGWNQTANDWKRVLRLEPGGSFGARLNGRLVGTTTTLNFGRELAWIGMVLVHPDLRGQGLGRRLMETALEHLRGRGIASIKLDATPAGKPLYEKLGFSTELIIERWEGIAMGRASEGAREARKDFPDSVRELDRSAFGVDRSAVVSALADDAHVAPLVIGDDAEPAGFALARPGLRADYIGPIVARDASAALSLLDAMQATLEGKRVYMDVNTEFALADGALAERGLVRQRELYRMRLGPSTPLGTSPLVMAIAGPELG